jgi:hypothetical protein
MCPSFLIIPSFLIQMMPNFQKSCIFAFQNSIKMATSEKFINPFTDFGFKKIFQVADLAGMNRKERQDYEESLKHYRDLKNSNDTARKDGKVEGKQELYTELVINHSKNGHAPEMIATFVMLPIEKVNQIIQDYQNGLYPNL